MGYQPKTYRKDSGDTLVIASGGTIETESGGAVEIQSGGAVEVESGGNIDIQQGANIKDSTKGVSADRIVFVEKAALSAATGTTGGGVLTWIAPTGSNVIVTHLVLHITTASTQAGCVLDAGTTSASATTKSATLIDGLVATGTAALGANDNLSGTGKGAVALTAGKWLTVTSTGTAATALAGNAYIHYITV